MNIKRGGTQNVALQSDPVPVSYDHLQNRLQTHQLEANASRQAAHPRHRCLIVGNVDGIYVILDHFGLFGDHIRVAAARRAAFRCDGQLPACQDLFKFAWGFRIHIWTSSLTTFRGPPARSEDQSFIEASFS